jgi:3-oxoadipate enol-lactonase
MTIAALNDIRIAYDDEGTGRPLVLIHGHPFDRSMWAPQVETVRRSGRRVIVPDLRGYGESTVVPGRTPLPVFAADVAALLDALGVERFVLGGLSMGGQIAMECYRQFAGRIDGLLLADTFPGADTEQGRRLRLDTADRLVREGMSGYAEENLAKMIAPYNVAARPDVAAHVRRMMLGAPPEGAAAALRGRADRPDYRDVLTTVTVPSLVVVGADDEFTPVGDAEQMHRLLPDSTLTVIEGAGHLPNLEQPAAFDAALRTLLGRVDGQP